MNFTRTPSGMIHRMRDPETSYCGKAITEGVRSMNARILSRCVSCERVYEIRGRLEKRIGGEAAKMRLLHELTEIVNRFDKDR